MKHLAILSLFALNSALFTLSAAVPLRWTVETSAANPATFDQFAGATYDLEATLQSRGKPLAVTGEPQLFWQTNGMGSVYWSAPASITNQTTGQSVNQTILKATWLPSYDVGARVYNCFIGITGTVYNAAFQLRLRPSPGAVPNIIDQPPRVLDLAHTVVVNPPWPTDATIDSRIRRVIDEDGITAPVETNVVTGIVSNVAPGIVSNVVDKSYVESLGITGGGSGGTDTNDVRAIVDEAVGGTNAVKDAVVAIPEIQSSLSSHASQLMEKITANDVRSIVSENYPTSETEWSVTNFPGRQLDVIITKEYVYMPLPDGSIEEGYNYTFAPQGMGQFYAYVSAGNEHEFTNFVFTTMVYPEEIISTFTCTREPWYNNGINKLGFSYHSNLTNIESRLEKKISEKADSSDLDPIRTDAASALGYARATYDYFQGNTNAWFSGTNYVIGADSTNRTHFTWEDGMDAATVPCSMSLWEIRDGARQCVWDQRDWTVWYWNFKIAQYREEHAQKDSAIRALIAQRAPLNWASYTACGLTNAATDTTWLDTPKVVLSAGYAWQHQVTVDGVGYWGIQGNGCVIGNSGTNATLRITDLEGNEVLKITKGSARLAYLTGGSGVGSGWDGGYMWYDMSCDAQPVGEFTVDSLDEFVEEGDDCPAEVREYEDRGGGVWRCYFRAKPGIHASACFARFKVQVGTETTVEYANAPTVNGGLIVDGVKIKPVIPTGATRGTVITWEVQ